MHKCNICSTLAPGNVDITDVTCDAVNLINWCDVGWNVSMHYYFSNCLSKVIIRITNVGNLSKQVLICSLIYVSVNEY